MSESIRAKLKELAKELLEQLNDELDGLTDEQLVQIVQVGIECLKEVPWERAINLYQAKKEQTRKC
jgi:hypothetical protein